MSVSAGMYKARGQEAGGEQCSAKVLLLPYDFIVAGSGEATRGSLAEGKHSRRAEIKSLGEYFHPPIIIFSIRHTSFRRKRFSRSKRPKKNHRKEKSVSEDGDVWQHGKRKYPLSRTNCCYKKRIILGPNAEWKERITAKCQHFAGASVAEVLLLYAVNVTLMGTSTATTGQ